MQTIIPCDPPPPSNPDKMIMSSNILLQQHVIKNPQRLSSDKDKPNSMDHINVDSFMRYSCHSLRMALILSA